MSGRRFTKGQSGNPAGRPKKRRPNVSAFGIIFDKRLTVTQGGQQRELTIDEALELQTYQAALKGSRMAVRKVLKMIEKREAALEKKSKPQQPAVTVSQHHSSDNANEALKALGIIGDDPGFGGRRLMVHAWATQAALGKLGRKKIDPEDIKNIKFFTFQSGTLRWPPGWVL